MSSDSRGRVCSPVHGEACLLLTIQAAAECYKVSRIQVLSAGKLWQVGQRRMADLAAAQAVALAECAASMAPVRLPKWHCMQVGCLLEHLITNALRVHSQILQYSKCWCLLNHVDSAA